MQMIGFIRASPFLLFVASIASIHGFILNLHAQSQQSFKNFNQQSPINPIEVVWSASVLSWDLRNAEFSWLGWIWSHKFWRMNEARAAFEKSCNMTSQWKEEILQGTCISCECKAMTVILAKWSWSDHQLDPNNGQSRDEYGNGLKKTLDI